MLVQIRGNRKGPIKCEKGKVTADYCTSYLPCHWMNEYLQFAKVATKVVCEHCLGEDL